MLYADENEYNASRSPLYILEGKIATTGIKEENPNLAKVDFNVLWFQLGKSDLQEKVKENEKNIITINFLHS